MDETNAAASGETATGSSDTGRIGKAKEYVGEKYASAAGAVKDGYASAAGAVKDGYNSVKEKVEEVDFAALTSQVRSYVRSNPGKALLVSVGAGFLIGLLLRRDEHD